MDQATAVEAEKREERKPEENPMRRIRIEKVVVNSCIGGNPTRLEKAAKIIEQLTGQKPELRKAKKTIKGFGIYRGQPIAVR